MLFLMADISIHFSGNNGGGTGCTSHHFIGRLNNQEGASYEPEYKEFSLFPVMVTLEPGIQTYGNQVVL